MLRGRVRTSLDLYQKLPDTITTTTHRVAMNTAIISPIQFSGLRINVEKLDPVTVLLYDIAPGQGRIIIEVWGRAWAMTWGGMGDRSIRAFFLSCDDEYLVNKLTCYSIPILKKARKNEDEYLGRIVRAVRQGLLAEMGVAKP